MCLERVTRGLCGCNVLQVWEGRAWRCTGEGERLNGGAVRVE